MFEPVLHRYLTLALIALAVPTCGWLFFVSAPYGRHVRDGWGPTIPARAGWILMESPTVLVFAAVYALSARATEPVPLVLLALWMLHYVHRTFVFPFRMRESGKRMPLSIPAAGFAFNVVNAYVNARWIGELGRYDEGWLASPAFLTGLALFATGMAINVHADTVLIALRRPGESGYRIPHGGMYRFVSSPNYLGELLEWTGWAVLTWSLPGLAFALYTAANLVPRARTNHAWYRSKFPDYPRDRRALLPFLW